MGRKGPSGNPANWQSATGEDAFLSGGAVHKPMRVRETRHWFFIGLDDARWDDIKYLPTYASEMVAKGTSFTSHRMTNGPCWPARAEWHTGHWAANHGMNAGDASGSITTFNDVYTTGYNDTPVTTLTLGRSTAQYMGPWSKDYAFQAGYNRKRVSHAQQTTDGVLRGSTDDVQAFTGNLYAQLDAEGVHVGFFGKLSNGYSPNSDPIPAGIERCYIEIESGGESLDQWNVDLRYNENATNPYDGDGLSGLSSLTLNGYSAGVATAMSWSGGVVTVTRASHGLSAGDEVTISGVTPSGYNGTYTVASVISSSQFTYALVSNPGSVTVQGNIYNREQYPPIYYLNKITAYLDTLEDCEPTFINLTTRLPHETDIGASNYNTAAEVKYDGTVNSADALSGGAYDSFYSAQRAVGYVGTATQQNNFAHRNDMLKTIDDIISAIVTYATARWGSDGFGIILCTDQGIQNGEMGTLYGNGGVKDAVWEGSARSMLTFRHTGVWSQNATVSRPTMHADIAPTILDCFGFSDHHWVTCDPTDPSKSGTRDGRSLLRVTDSGDVAYHRMTPIHGTFKSGIGYGWIHENGWKYVNLDTAASGRTYDPVADYEFTQTDPGSTLRTTYRNLQTTLFTSGRFAPTTDTNVMHTTASP